MKILTQEISDRKVIQLSELSEELQNKLKEQKCVRCDKSLNQSIDYVVCSNGNVRWWCKKHYYLYSRHPEQDTYLQ